MAGSSKKRNRSIEKQRRSTATPTRPIPEGVQVGGINGGDYHCWLEDTTTGKVVGEPTFSSYEGICKMRGLDIKKPHFFAWDNQEKWLEEKGVNDKVKAFRLMSREERNALKHKFPMDHMCGTNASYTWIARLNGNKRFVLRVGSMGWERTDNGKVFWEFG